MRPLFEPLSERHERADEWSEPLGFVIGGFSTPSVQQELDGTLAEQFFSAAEVLVDAVLNRHVADYTVANAALFLYRHCFELLLKAGLPPDARFKKNTHHLGSLVRSYAHHERQAGRTVPTLVTHRCDELASIDPGSEVFRYGYSESDELCVNLRHLRSAMRELRTALVEPNWLVRMSQGDLPDEA